MSIGCEVSRRGALRLGLGAGAGTLGGIGFPFAACAQETLLRAGITGFATMNTLDPAKHSLIPESYVIWAVFNALLKFNEKMEIVTDLAESYTALDPTTLEFKLRAGVKFHDGSPLTSDDVKFTLERLLDEKFASPNRSKVSSIQEVKIVDPLTFQIKTKAAFAPLLTYLTNTRSGTQIVPRKVVTAIGDEAFAKKPVGTGAYMLKDWKATESLELVAFNDYFGGKPKMSRVMMPIIPEESSGMTALLGGQLDLTSEAPFADVPSLEANKAVKVFKQAGLNTRYIVLNIRKPPFDDVHFRRALSMAFDRRAMVRAVLFGEGELSPGILPPALLPAEARSIPDLMLFNPEKAKAELALSEYKPGVEATISIWGPNWWRRIGEIFVAQVNQVLGTKFVTQAGDANALFSQLKVGEFQAVVWGWLGLVDPEEYLGEILGKGGFRNFQGYDNPAFDDLMAQGRSELDPNKRRQIYVKANLLMLEDMPLIPCFSSNIHNLATPKLSGFAQLPYSNYGDQFSKISLG
ncbi:MAG: ABC transporter substrate-binding protein [Hyphomicrobiales bacterium]